ncbi:hypothetical protein [Ramlibacter aurantiacus]|uniref:hypothetical protein n=1 Tax=Ramlibacter aurantiacus TaxID=2801330 RepID=UPI001F25E03B|nr:hypothetical protein [Ramlibacter aurantiacus]
MPFVVGMYVYLVSLYQGLVRNLLLRDADTLSHIGAGRWIIANLGVPDGDPFSHSKPGAFWAAHEWLSQVLLALGHEFAGFTGVVALTGLAFAVAIAMLTRALMDHFSPTRSILFAVIAVLMTSAHLLARPHILAMPLLVLWTISLVRAGDSGRAPSLWLLPVMTVWANMHGGFTLGIVLAFAFAGEALWAVWPQRRWAEWLKGWGVFLGAMLIAAVVTPQGPSGIQFTWQVLVEDQYALSRIGEWASPNFHEFQPLLLWLLGGLALVLHRGLRLPPFRLLMVLGLLYLSLKHIRNVELLGLLVPLIVAKSFAAQWHRMPTENSQPDAVQRWLNRLSADTSRVVVGAFLALAMASAIVIERVRPMLPPADLAPVKAFEAAKAAGLTGPVLNAYSWGGYLILLGVPVHIDGRSDMYRDDFIREYLETIELRRLDTVEPYLAKYRIQWTLLPRDLPIVSALDQMPGWERLYSDDRTVVHRRKVDHGR